MIQILFAAKTPRPPRNRRQSLEKNALNNLMRALRTKMKFTFRPFSEVFLFL
jgi:hypothetical protein